MPRCGLLLVVLAAATLGVQSGSSQSTALSPSQTPPAPPATPTPEVASQSPKVMPVTARKVELVASPVPRSLDLPQGVAFPVLLDVTGIALCDPIPCRGDGPRFVLVDGKVTIHFPDSYRKPNPETKDGAKEAPASPETGRGQGPTRK